MDINEIINKMFDGTEGSMQAGLNLLEARASQQDESVKAALSDEDKALLAEAQALWPTYAEKRGHNPQATIGYVAWIKAWEADGIKVGKTPADALRYLRSQVG
jgi:hypothetical protein